MRRIDAGLAAFSDDPRFTGAVSGCHIAVQTESPGGDSVVGKEPVDDVAAQEATR